MFQKVSPLVRRHTVKTLRSLPLLLFLVFPSLLSAQTPVGRAVQVAVASRSPYGADVAMSPRGDFVVAWVRAVSNGLSGVFGRIYAADGSPRTGEFRINASRSDRAFAVRLAMMDDGSFVAVFATPGFVLGRRFTAEGKPLGGNFKVAHSQFNGLEVGARGDGGFVVAWSGTSVEIATRVYGADGQPLGPVVQAVAARTGVPRLAVRSDGSFLVVWTEVEPAGPDFFFKGRLFNADGTPRGESFRISEKLSVDDFSFIGYDTAVDSEGNFLVTWFLRGIGPVQSSTFLRRYAPDGTPLGEQSLAGHRPAGQEIAAGPDGGFVSIWQTAPEDPVSVAVRQFAADGSPLHPLVVLNQQPYIYSGPPLLAGNGTGSFVATWFGKPRRGEGAALFVQRLRTE
jgi:hypothetical protein